MVLRLSRIQVVSLSSMGRADFGENPRVEFVSGSDGYSTAGERPQGRRPAPSFQLRPFPQDRSGPDLSDTLPVNLHLQDAVQQKEDRIAELALLDQCGTRL